MPFAARRYRWYLPLMPTAIESLDLTGYDLVISSSHCVAKGAIARPDAVHISYTHSPMRYLWDLWPQYFPTGSWRGRISRPLLTWLRAWDVAASARVDQFVANSAFVARRVRRYYRRDSEVVHPPIEVDRFANDDPPGDDYLMVSALVPSKNVELALESFRGLDRRLDIVGSGHLYDELRRSAPDNVRLLGRLSDEELAGAYARCRALVHTAVEDFGIVPLEAAAAGRPTLALGVGGSLETVVPPGGEAPATGVLFDEATPASLRRSLRELEELGTFEPERLVEHARRFDRPCFERRMTGLVEAALRGER